MTFRGNLDSREGYGALVEVIEGVMDSVHRLAVSKVKYIVRNKWCCDNRRGRLGKEVKIDVSARRQI